MSPKVTFTSTKIFTRRGFAGMACGGGLVVSGIIFLTTGPNSFTSWMDVIGLFLFGSLCGFWIGGGVFLFRVIQESQSFALSPDEVEPDECVIYWSMVFYRPYQFWMTRHLTQITGVLYLTNRSLVFKCRPFQHGATIFRIDIDEIVMAKHVKGRFPELRVEQLDGSTKAFIVMPTDQTPRMIRAVQLAKESFDSDALDFRRAFNISFYGEQPEPPEPPEIVDDITIQSPESRRRLIPAVLVCILLAASPFAFCLLVPPKRPLPFPLVILLIPAWLGLLSVIAFPALKALLHAVEGTWTFDASGITQRTYHSGFCHIPWAEIQRIHHCFNLTYVRSASDKIFIPWYRFQLKEWRMAKRIFDQHA